MAGYVPSCCGPWQIWAVNRDGTGATNLTNDETVNDMFPAWSPDGTQIVFSRSNGAGGTDLYAMPAPTSLPPASPLRAAALAGADAAIAAVATQLTADGNADDPDWGRNPDAPPSPKPYTLFASVATIQPGAGGIVVSRPAGILCGPDCSQPYAPGTRVTLAALPKSGSSFVGWSGACAGSPRICSVPMLDVKTAKAWFRRAR